MVHGAPDYVKSVYIPPVTVEVQDLGIYPAWEMNISKIATGYYPGGSTVYTVPANKVLYIFSTHLNMVNDSESLQNGYLRINWYVQGGTAILVHLYAPGMQTRFASRCFSPPFKLVATETVIITTSGFWSNAHGGFTGRLLDA